MTIDELLDHYRYKLALPNLTKRSRTIAESTYMYLLKLRAINEVVMEDESDEEFSGFAKSPFAQTADKRLTGRTEE